eukprot:TRINITY_DN110065_c0_g1_i1.p1 TRINITY_DN110065_c0_g1~~TRINITY_DN110065_c0_g1_i1.p1  ORF type:complete len:525 (+),score=109.32 TRINITY_DN110065_c0_g1_i1:61-1575(+)
MSKTLKGHSGLIFRPLPAADVPKAADIEARSYPADEAASPEKLEYRQRVAPELFYGVYQEGSGGAGLIAFIVSTAAQGEDMEEESMSVHVSGGDSICIHSVAVDAPFRRRGIARSMVRAYVEALAADQSPTGKAAKRMLLIAHANLLGLYRQCGFEFLGPSKVVHGSEAWYDMRLDLEMERSLEFAQVDAFSPVALAGNPAAVLFTQRSGDADWMHAVAVENNLAETAFLERREDKEAKAGEVSWDIRWFTPGGEVDLCGHATLGSAHSLWDTGRAPRASTIAFHTRNAGVLRCAMVEDTKSTAGSRASCISMDFPSQPPRPAEGLELEKKKELASALGVKEEDVVYIGRGPKTTPDWLLELTPTAFTRLRANMGALERVKPMERGLIVTCAGNAASVTGDSDEPAAKKPRVLAGSGSCESRFDFSSRFFAPGLGVPEDPVTGSAHCVLAPYWATKLGMKEGDVMRALQASPRGGVLWLRLLDSGKRVELVGEAVTVLRGRMTV